MADNNYDEKLEKAKFNDFFHISEWIRQQSLNQHISEENREKFDFVFTEMAIKYRNIRLGQDNG